MQQGLLFYKFRNYISYPYYFFNLCFRYNMCSFQSKFSSIIIPTNSVDLTLVKFILFIEILIWDNLLLNI